jgi:rhodanese-related sulfurtransferase
MGFFSKLFGQKTDYKQLMENGAIVVDVRSPQEFKSGHLKGSKNIPLGTLSGKVKALNGKEVILVCRSGGRAASAKSILTNHGIKSHNAGAWQNLQRL